MRLGIDLGGTKIAAVVLDHDGAVRWQTRVPTPRGDYHGTLEVITDIVSLGERTVGTTCSVGLGIPGAVSRTTGLIKNANSTWLNGRPFQSDLVTRRGRPVRLANDANCLAVSEATDGAGAGAFAVFAVILGTGAGGGIVLHGRLLEGANAIGGEWGHNPLPWPDERDQLAAPCYCGQTGCIEQWVSGTGLADDHARVTGVRLIAESIVARAADGDVDAEATLARWERRLAKSLASIINVIDPDVIVVGGGVSRIARIYETIPALWGEWVFSDAVTTRIAPAMHGDTSGVRGAAWLWNAGVLC